MNRTMRRALLAGVSAIALVPVPYAAGERGFPGFADTAAYAKNNKGNNGNRGGGSRGNSGNRSSSSSRSDNPGNGGNNGNNSSSNGQAVGNPHVVNVSAEAPLDGEDLEWTPPGQDRERSLDALLGRLHSLQRDYEGLMHSNADFVAPFRDYVVNTAEMELADAALSELLAGFEAPEPDLLFDGYVYPADPKLEDIQARLAALEGVDAGQWVEVEGGDVLLAQYDAEYLALQTLLASPEVGTYLDSLDGTGLNALNAAIAVGANPNREYTEEELARMREWIDMTLGVGDANGAVDEYQASLGDDDDVPNPASPPADYDPEAAS